MIRRLLVACAVAVAPASAATWHVDASNPNCPGNGSAANPFCTIQAAIQAAAIGDVILVQPGTYVENLDYLGKDVEVASTGGAAVTIIDGNQAGSCVAMYQGEGPGAVLRGFTIVNGSGTPGAFGVGGYVCGRGVYCLGGSPRILENVFVGSPPPLGTYDSAGEAIYCLGGSPVIAGNEFDGLQAEFGGGVACWASQAPVIEGNTFRHTRAGTGGGGVALLECTGARVEANDFFDNGGFLLGTFYTESGGGLFARAVSGLVVRNNSFVQNAAEYGGAVKLEALQDALLEDNVFDANAGYWGAGGVAAYACDDVVYRRCGFFDNNSGSTGGIESGPAPDGTGGGSLIEDCTFARNSSGSSGPWIAHAVFLSANSSNPARIARCRFLENPGTSGYGAAVVVGKGAVIEDTLFARNTSGAWLLNGAVVRRCTFAENLNFAVILDGFGIVMESSIAAFSKLYEFWNPTSFATIQVSDSLIMGGFPGVNVINADPQFVSTLSGDYRLLPTSPCIDLGSATDASCGVDVAGRPRRVSGAFANVARVDMGAHEFSHVDLAAVKTAPLTFQIDSTGTAGLNTLMFVGLAPAETCLPPAGTLLIDVAKPWVLVPWLPLPSSVPVAVPPLPSLPPQIRIQQLALGPTGSGNLSGVAVLELP